MKIFLLALTNLFSIFCFGQIPSLYRSPLDIPLRLISGFGDIRTDHFHAGYDISTQNKSQPLYAIEEGYVSRFKVSNTGFGNAIYINHPDGYQSVYAHMQKFSDLLDSIAKKILFEKKRYDFDTILTNKSVYIKKGELIGYSGTTGHSSGHHLHFEIRDHLSEKVMNPWFLGFFEHDSVSPEIWSVQIFPGNKSAVINQQNKPLMISLLPESSKSKKEIPKKNKMPEVSGWIGFGFKGGDKISEADNPMAIYDMKLEIDSQQVFHARFDEFEFNDTRCVNGFIDYPARIKSGDRIIRCVVPDHNMVGIYRSNKHQGYFYFQENRVYNIRFILTDKAGNSKIQDFQVQGSAPTETDQKNSVKEAGFLVIPGKQETIVGDGFQAIIGSESIFDTTSIAFSETKLKNACSNEFSLGETTIGLNKPIIIRFKPILTSPESKNKLVIVRSSGNTSTGIGSTWNQEWIEGLTKRFGKFRVVEDHSGPVIKMIIQNPEKPKPVKGKKRKKSATLKPQLPAAKGRLAFFVKDSQAGVKDIRAYLNGKWVLLEPGDNEGQLDFIFPKELDEGQYTFRLEATDNLGNLSIKETQFKK